MTVIYRIYLRKESYVETSTKNKPTYGQDDISNAAVFFQSNNRGILKSMANINGDGIPCNCDQINIASAHKLQSTTHDNQKLNSIRKVELIFNRIYIKEQTDEEWPDVWKQILCDDLMSNQIYAGVMFQGPNFNPRIETMQIITPAEIPSDLSHQSDMHIL